MKKALLIIGGLAALLIASLVALALWSINSKESELNRKRTEKARQTRLENLSREPEPELVVEKENENKNENNGKEV